MATERNYKYFSEFKPASLFAVLISVIIIAYIIHKTDFALLALSFKKLNPYWVIMMSGVYLLGFIVRGLRWHFMLLPIKTVKTRCTTEGVIVGYMANNILPARAGELMRAIFIGNKESISKTSAFGTILIERIFDGLVLVGILIIGSFLVKSNNINDDLVNSIIVIGSLLFGSAMLIVLMGVKYRHTVEIIFAYIIKHLPQNISGKSHSIVEHLLDSLNFLKTNKNLPSILICSVFVWLIEGLVFWIGFLAFQLPGDFAVAYFTLALVNLGMLVPSAPGGIGIFQGGTILAFSFFGITIENALSYSITVHSIMIIPITIIGLFIINRYGLSIFKITINTN